MMTDAIRITISLDSDAVEWICRTIGFIVMCYTILKFFEFLRKRNDIPLDSNIHQ
jgi:hypothetical protein